MSTLVSLRDVSKAFGLRTLFTGISLAVSRKERIGLVGANGSGKSTLLKILAGLEAPDGGERTLRQGVRMAYVPQAAPSPRTARWSRSWPRPWPSPCRPPTRPRSIPAWPRSSAAWASTTRAGPWSCSPAAGASGWPWPGPWSPSPTCSCWTSPPTTSTLAPSCGWRNFLRAAPFAYVVVSHDRCFLENVAGRTIELGRAYPEGYLSVDGAYSVLLEKREAFLAGQAEYEQSLANRARREIEWLRRQPQARATKAKARIDAAGRLQQELAATRDRNRSTGRASIDFTATGRQTRRLLVAEGIAKGFGERTFFHDLDVVLSPGVRLGLAGGNGCGKTTLLRVLAGELAPDRGAIEPRPRPGGGRLDQRRHSSTRRCPCARPSPPSATPWSTSDRSLHVVSWAKRFLFRPEQLDLPVGLLSGGEQARLLVARLMLQPGRRPAPGRADQRPGHPHAGVPKRACWIPRRRRPRHSRPAMLDRVATVPPGAGRQGRGRGLRRLRPVGGRLPGPREGGGGPRGPGQGGGPPAGQGPGQEAQLQGTARVGRPGGGHRAGRGRGRPLQAALEDPAVASDAARLESLLDAAEAARAEVDRLYARWAELEAKQAEG